MKRTLALTLAALALLSATAAAQCGSCARANTPACHSARTVSPLAGLTLVSAYGDTVALSEYIGREPTVVVFLRPDGASTRAMDSTEWAFRHYPAARFVGIMAADAKKTTGAAVRVGAGYPLLSDPQGKAAASLGIDTMPAALFFDSAGAVAFQTSGFTRARITKGLDAILAPAEYVDPVCGMKVAPATAAGTFAHQGKTYYFCNESCRDAFARDPQKYLNKQ